MPVVAQLLWHSLDMLPLVVALAAVLVTAVVWLYPAQVRNVRRPWRWVLPGLRALGLLALAISILQPVVQRLRRAEERGAVLVLVDRSKSMSVTDLTRSPAQLVALADGLARLPDRARDAASSALRPALERLRDLVGSVAAAGHDLEAAEAFGRGIEPARERLLAARSDFAAATGLLAQHAARLPDGTDLRAQLTAIPGDPDAAARDKWAADTRARIDAALAAVATLQADADRRLYETNPQVKAACDELGQLSRWSLVGQALLRPETGLVSRLAGDAPVTAYAVADSVGAITLPGVAGSGPAPQLPVPPDGAGSDIVGAVPAALAAAAADGRPVRAVVLFSDGRQVGAGDAAIVSGLAPAGVPVFAVGVASPGRPRDVAFARDVAVPASAFVGETVTVRASVAATGMPAGATDVQLKAGDGQPLQSRRVELKADGTPSRIEFAVRLEQGGPQRVTLSVPPAPGEITAENNVVERWVKVLPERMKVAAFAGTPGWDFQLLRGLLARTPWVRLEAGVLDPVKPRLPLSAEQILRQDVVILSDVAAAALDEVQWDAVNRLVRERGGSLFLLAGPDHLPSSYTPATIVPSALLPFDVRSFAPAWRTWPGEQAAFRFVPPVPLPPAQADALRLGAGQGSLGEWQGLDGAFRFMPVPELSTRVGTRALLVEADSRLPVLTEGLPGNGRVFFLGTNETWRWRYKAGGRDFERFWLQLIRYAAGEPYAAQGELIALDTSKVAVAPGEPVTVRARILRDDADAFRVDVSRDDKPGQRLTLAPLGAAGSGRYATTIPGLAAGDYVVRLANPTESNPTAPTLSVPLHVAGSSEAEMADVSGDDDVLRRIADASGGQFLTLDRLGELPRLLAGTGEMRSRFSEISLWDSPLLFLFVVACFGAEWALRKRVGLA